VQIHASPDSNVRPARSRAAGGPAPTPFRRVARSLLSSRVVGVLLLAAASSMSACIIPVAPNFQDPPTQPTSVPALQASFGTPVPNTINTIQDSSSQISPPIFSVAVTDPDPNVTLFYRWVFDYPPHTDVSRLGTDSSTTAWAQQPLTQKVSCDFIVRTMQPSNGEHRLELLVSTSDWKSSDGSPNDFEETVVQNAPLARLNWIIVFQSGCPVLQTP
jgi:hypothetical protein